mgnify:CR=1 FL=1
MEALNMVVVHDKLDANDRFIKTWSSFDTVKQGEQIGVRADGTPVTAEFDAYILFPDVNAAANAEWAAEASAVRPEIASTPVFETEGARHPVVEAALRSSASTAR